MKSIAYVFFGLLLIAILNIFVHLPSKALATSTSYYVSKNGSNADGLSWTTAWSELANINWASIQPGDTIVIDGGNTPCASNYNFQNHSTSRPGVNCGMQYNTTLTVGKSGTSTAPITIKLATDTGHDGTAVFFGGRSTLLPYCSQTGYSATGTARAYGILIGDYHNNTSYQYVTIDGVKRSGFMVYGNQIGVGIRHDNDSFITLRNLEIFDNGIFSGTSSKTDNPGVGFVGHDLTFERLLVHDNGQDGFQDQFSGNINNNSHAAMSNLAIYDSWIYNRRDNPVSAGYPFNEGPNQACTHVDGVQIWGGGLHQQGFTVRGAVFGPLLAQGFYGGDFGSAGFDNVSITDSLFINALGANINSDGNNAPTNWTIQNITSYLTTGSNPTFGSNHGGVDITGSGHTLKDIIHYYGYYSDANSVTTASGNIWFGGDPVDGGTNVNPNFVGPLATTNTPNYATLIAADYTPQCATCTGKGSSIHTVQDLLNRIDSLNTSSNPTNTPTPTPTPTPIVNTPTPTSVVPTPTPTTVLPTNTPTPTPPGDNIAPSVAITFPTNGATVTHNTNITITATASDNVGVTKVEFYAAGVLKCTDTASPYTCRYLTPKNAGVQVVLSAKAYDAANNNSTNSVTITTIR